MSVKVAIASALKWRVTGEFNGREIFAGSVWASDWKGATEDVMTQMRQFIGRGFRTEDKVNVFVRALQ